MKLAEFLFSTIRDRGTKQCFGVPGDYILPLYKTLDKIQGLEAIVGTHEPCAVFSADAFARINGFGVVLVTYGVGALNIMNGVACAYAESSPLLVISGAPPTGATDGGSLYNPQFHHVVKNMDSQIDAFRPITDICLKVESAETASETIQKAIYHTEEKRLPVYLEIPIDLMQADIPVNPVSKEKPEIDNDLLNSALEFFIDKISRASNPVLQVGAEAGRYGLQKEVEYISEQLNLPVVFTALGKGVLSEEKENYLGVYAGILSPNKKLRKFVENSDLVFMLGTKVTDVNCGAFTADLKKENLLIANENHIGDGFIKFEGNIPFDIFIKALSENADRIAAGKIEKFPESKFDYHASGRIMDKHLAIINDFITDKNTIVADTGDSCYGSIFMNTRRKNGYFAPLFYNTMGFAVPAAVGVQLADPETRPVVLVGDGAFQMTGMEFSTMVKHNLNPVIIVFNNDGYGMQRVFQEGEFNTLGQWDYTKITELTGGGKSFKASTPEELANVLEKTRNIDNMPVLIEVIVPRGEISTGLKLFSDAVRREKTGTCPLRTDNTHCDHETKCAFCRASVWD